MRTRTLPGLAVVVLLQLVGLIPISVSGPAMQSSVEYEVKAAFLLNFTKFIGWPERATPGAESPFSICIWGDDPFGPVLDKTIQGESVNGHPLVVQRLGHTDPKACQILYLGHLEKGTERATKELLGSLGPGTLTVGEGDNFVRDGGMVAFVVENRRVRFNINLSASRNGLLTMSSRLLAVAKTVYK
jgi:hypothetical protein